MKAASVKDIKTELEHQSQSKLLSLCLKLTKFKKENKELLTYLLFEADNENAYIDSVKNEIVDKMLSIFIESLKTIY